MATKKESPDLNVEMTSLFSVLQINMYRQTMRGALCQICQQRSTINNMWRERVAFQFNIMHHGGIRQQLSNETVYF